MNTKINIFWFAFAAAIIILLFGGFVTYPIGRGIIEDHAKMFLQKQDFALISADTKNVEQFQRSLELYDTELERLSGLFIDQVTPIEFIEFLEQLAETHQVDLTVSLGSTGKAKGDPWFSTSFRLSLQGTHTNTLRVLEKIENAPYLVELESVEIEKKQRGRISIAQIDTVVALKVYTKKTSETE